MIEHGGWPRAATYEFVTRGGSGHLIAAALVDFDVRTDDDGSNHLIGPVPDQSGLLGVLCRLQSLGLEVTSMRRLDREMDSQVAARRGS